MRARIVLLSKAKMAGTYWVRTWEWSSHRVTSRRQCSSILDGPMCSYQRCNTVYIGVLRRQTRNTIDYFSARSTFFADKSLDAKDLFHPTPLPGKPISHLGAARHDPFFQASVTFLQASCRLPT